MDESSAVIDQTFALGRERLSTVFLFLKYPTGLLGDLSALPQTLRLRQVLGGEWATPSYGQIEPFFTTGGLMLPNGNTPRQLRRHERGLLTLGNIDSTHSAQ